MSKDPIEIQHIKRLNGFYSYLQGRLVYLVDPLVSPSYKMQIIDAIQKPLPEAKRSLMVLIDKESKVYEKT